MKWLSIFALAGCCLHADTVTTADNRSWNGTIVSYQASKLSFKGKFSSGDKTFDVNRRDLKMLEFNSATYNPGPPPKALGLKGSGSGQGVAPPAPAAPVGPQDQLMLRGGDEKQCDLVSIDEGTVKCGAGSFSRGGVRRVILHP